MSCDLYPQYINLCPSLTHFSPVVASQRQCRDDLCLIPMTYEDSLSEPPPSSHMFEPQTCSAIKPPDSESYGSLHTDDRSEDRVVDQLKDTDEFGLTEVKVMKKQMEGLDGDSHVDTGGQQLITGDVETANQSKHTRSRSCVVLWAGHYFRNGWLTINYLAFVFASNQNSLSVYHSHHVLHQTAIFSALSLWVNVWYFVCRRWNAVY